MKKQLSKILKLSVISLVVIALLLGVGLPVMADTDETENGGKPLPPNMLRGKVTAIGDKQFTIQPPAEGKVIKIDDNTKYYVVRLPIPRIASVKPLPTQVPEQVREKVMEKKQASLRERIMSNLPWVKKPPKVDENAPQAADEEALKQKRVVERGLGNKVGQAEDLPELEGLTEQEEIELAGGLANEGGIGALKNWRNRVFNALRKFAKKGTFEDIAVGDRVVVKVMPNENLAKLVLIIKAPVARRVHGTYSLSGNAITLTKADGTIVNLTWDSNTRFVLKGMTAAPATGTATIVYNSETKIAKLVVIPGGNTTAAELSTALGELNEASN